MCTRKYTGQNTIELANLYVVYAMYPAETMNVVE